MNILFCSVPFYPSVGGIEMVSAVLAERFVKAGHDLTLVTQTPYEGQDSTGFRIVRRPGAQELTRLVREADVVVHNNISLRLGWPMAMIRRPWVIAHQTWIGHEGVAAHAKRRMLPYARHIAISRAVAEDLAVPSTLVPNPYAHELFRVADDVVRGARSLVFVGRLVSDKGCDRLVRAMALLREQSIEARLTIIGDGPEAPALRALTESLGLGDRIEFTGKLTGEPLVAKLNEHAIMVVPSVWEEPFGIVALEGIACGCVPVVTRRGGLPDAVGECGVVVPGDEPAALAGGIRALLEDPAAVQGYRAKAAAHLARHTVDRIAEDYLQVIDDARLASGLH